jgi:ribosomal protein S6
LEERTNVYEALYIFDANRFARERAALPAEVEKAIQTAGGEVLVSRLWEERRLAYPIAGQRKGTYWLIYFRGTAQSPMGNARHDPSSSGAEGAPPFGRGGVGACQRGAGPASAGRCGAEPSRSRSAGHGNRILTTATRFPQFASAIRPLRICLLSAVLASFTPCKPADCKSLRELRPQRAATTDQLPRKDEPEILALEPLI